MSYIMPIIMEIWGILGIIMDIGDYMDIGIINIYGKHIGIYIKLKTLHIIQ